MAQDVRASFISTLSNLNVSHNSGTVVLRSAYWSDRFSTVLPAVFVRSVNVDRDTDISNTMKVDSGVYDLALTVVDRQASGSEPAIDAEVFLKDAADAVEVAVAAVKNSLGVALSARLINSQDTEATLEDGTLVFYRVLTFRAQSAS